MRRPIDIAYMIDVLDTDMAGTENQLIKMINGLDRKHFRVRLVCLSDHPWLRANASSLACASKTFEIRKFKRISTYLDFLRLVGWLRRDRPDIVHTFFPVSNIVGVLAARMAGVKTVVSSRRDYGEWMRPSYLAATKFVNRFASAIVANSSAVGELTRRKEAVSNGKVRVILNGLDLTPFVHLTRNRDLQHELSIPNDAKIIGLVANFRPMKNHHTFFRAAREILTARPDAYFLLVGDGQLLGQSRQLAEELGLLDHCRFAGRRQDVLPLISIMDVGVNCSEMEGLSNAVMEYMAAGVPCVVSRSGGNPDLITHGVHGYTFELDDVGALARWTLELLANSDRGKALAAAAREKIEREMSLQAMLANYEALYASLAGFPRPVG